MHEALSAALRKNWSEGFLSVQRSSKIHSAAHRRGRTCGIASDEQGGWPMKDGLLVRQLRSLESLTEAQSLRAGDVLSKFPDSEAAWDALARFYHTMPQLAAAFDLLMFTKASDWLDEDSTPVKLYEIWRRRVA
jgi:hypothetical protein